MEIICIDKKTFDEFRIRFCELESRLARLCRSGKDMGLKNWMDNRNQGVFILFPPLARLILSA